MRPLGLAIVAACIAAWGPGRAWGQTTEPAADGGPADGGPAIAAIVNGEPIPARQIEAAYQAVLQGRQLKPHEANEVKAKLLGAAIDNLLVAQAFERDSSLVTQDEVDKQLAALRSQVEKEGKKLEDVLAAQGGTLEDFRKSIVLRIAAPRYLEKKLRTAIRDYFNAHRREYDGTEIRVSHIILRPDRFDETPAQMEARAAKIREQITSGKLSFADAAKEYSDGPSREIGGDLGFMPRHGAMVEAFAKAAFALKQGEISEPVSTTFGTHLITITETKPGDKEWTDVVQQLQTLVAKDLMSQLAAEQRESATIEYTGRIPYIKPGTTEVIAESPGETP